MSGPVFITFNSSETCHIAHESSPGIFYSACGMITLVNPPDAVHTEQPATRLCHVCSENGSKFAKRKFGQHFKFEYRKSTEKKRAAADDHLYADEYAIRLGGLFEDQAPSSVQAVQNEGGVTTVVKGPPKRFLCQLPSGDIVCWDSETVKGPLRAYVAKAGTFMAFDANGLKLNGKRDDAGFLVVQE